MNKAALKRAYKQAKPAMGVYRISVSEADKVFLGFALDLQARFNRHRAELKFGTHRNRELQELWNSLGEPALEFEILDVLDHDENAQASPLEELQVLAEMWAAKLEEAGHSIVLLKNG